MANIASSKKDARRSAVRAVRNRGIKSAVKTKVTKFRRAAAEGGQEAGELGELAERAIASLDRAVSKGVLHRNNAARRKARLAKRLNATGAEQPAAASTRPAARGTAKASTAKPAARAKAPAAKKPAAKKPAPKKS